MTKKRETKTLEVICYLIESEYGGKWYFENLYECYRFTFIEFDCERQFITPKYFDAIEIYKELKRKVAEDGYIRKLDRPGHNKDS